MPREKPLIKIRNNPSHIGEGHDFSNFKYSNNRELGNPFNQRIKLKLGHDHEADVTERFADVEVGEKVLLQFMSNDPYMRVVEVIHDGTICAVYAEQSKFGIFHRKTKKSIKFKGIALRGTNPRAAQITFNIYKLTYLHDVYADIDILGPHLLEIILSKNRFLVSSRVNMEIRSINDTGTVMIQNWTSRQAFQMSMSMKRFYYDLITMTQRHA